MILKTPLCAGQMWIIFNLFWTLTPYTRFHYVRKKYNQTWEESGYLFFLHALLNVTFLFTCVGLSLEKLSDKQHFKFSSLIIYNVAEDGDLKLMLYLHRQ